MAGLISHLSGSDVPLSPPLRVGANEVLLLHGTKTKCLHDILFQRCRDRGCIAESRHSIVKSLMLSWLQIGYPLDYLLSPCLDTSPLELFTGGKRGYLHPFQSLECAKEGASEVRYGKNTALGQVRSTFYVVCEDAEFFITDMTSDMKDFYAACEKSPPFDSQTEQRADVTTPCVRGKLSAPKRRHRSSGVR